MKGTQKEKRSRMKTDHRISGKEQKKKEPEASETLKKRGTKRTRILFTINNKREQYEKTDILHAFFSLIL